MTTPRITPKQRAFWATMQRRAARLSPQMGRAVLAAFDRLRAKLDVPEVRALIEAGNTTELINSIFSPLEFEDAYAPVREAMREAVSAGARATVPMLPTAAASGRTIAGFFNILSPTVIEAIRGLESKSLGTLSEDTREVVRAFIEQGLRTGVNPRTIARDLRASIGLAPNQLEAVDNFERALRGVRDEAGRLVAGNPLTRALRDKRFDAAIKKGGLTEEQIQKMVARYRERYIALNAETHARTATLDALRLGQRTTWEQAIARGDLDGAAMTKTWIATMDERTREEHLAAHGLTVGFDELFPVDGGVMIPGENTYNCRCVAEYSTAKKS